ncbi:hypothetical protein ACV2E1_21545, partial [Salmonella enterica subsp. enterica serovar Minnesota]
NQESRLPPGSDFRRWVWITIAPFVTLAAFKQLELFWVYNIFVGWIKTVLVNVISRHISA